MFNAWLNTDRGLLRLFIVIFTLFTLTSTSHADSLRAPQLVVTATRFDASIDSAPVNITTITAEEITRSNATNLSDVLRYQAGVTVTDLFGVAGYGASVDMGGFGQNNQSNTLIMLNGRRLNDVDLQALNLAIIPLASIEKIEIVHGSSTVLYGDNAVSGVINIVTKNGFDAEQGNISIQAGSFQTKKISGNALTHNADTALSLSFDTLKSNGYRDNNETDNISFVSEVLKNIASAEYGARIISSKQDMELPATLSEADFENDPTQSNSDETSNEARYALEMFIKGDHLSADLAYRKKHQDYKTGTYESEGDLQTLSFTPRIHHLIGNHNLTTGIDYYKSTLEASSPFSSEYVTQDSKAIYLTDTITINSQITFSLGARRQAIDVAARNVISDNDMRSDAVNAWDVNLGYRLGDNTNSYIRVAKSFRSASMDEMWNYFSGEFNTVKPQIGKHYELGIRHKINGSEISINIFRINLRDEIAYDYSTFSNVNLDKTLHEGATFQARSYIVNDIAVSAGYTYRKAIFLDQALRGNAIPLVPNHKLNISGSYDFTENQQFSLDMVYIGERYFGDDTNNDGKRLPGYARYDLAYTYEKENWKYRFQVKNLMNTSNADFALYRTTDYFYYPLPERAFYLTLESTF